MWLPGGGSNGEWAPRWFKGPADFDSWAKSWDVFAAAMVMLDFCSPASLTEYKRGIQKLNGKWSHLGGWHHIAWADIQVRSQMWDRILENGLAERPPTIDQSDRYVWDGIIQKSAWRAAGKSELAEWWEENCQDVLANTVGRDRHPQGDAQPAAAPIPPPAGRCMAGAICS